MEYIYNETLTWVVDGVNKTFNTIYDIFKIEEVYVGWVSYRGVSHSWNTVTFNDAPPLWSWQPSIDYFETTTTPPPTEWDVTLWLIIDDVYDKLVQERVSGWVPNDVYKEGQIKNFIISWWRKMKNKRVQNFTISSYSFRKARSFTTSSKDWANINIGEWSDIPASWKIALDNWAIIDYNSYSWWTIYTDWWVWEEGSMFTFWYKLPSTVLKPSEVLVWGRVLEYEDQREWTAHSNWFTIVDGYLFMPKDITDNVVVVKFIKKHPVLSADADIIPIEFEYFDVLSYYALYKICQLVEDDRWQAFKREWQETERDWKSYKSRSVEWINNTLRSSVLNINNK